MKCQKDGSRAAVVLRSCEGRGRHRTRISGQTSYWQTFISWTPARSGITAHLKKIISKAIVDLPEKQRLVLSLYYYEDLNLKEIGRVLDVTESRVSQLHTQAVIRLRNRLKSHWDDFIQLMETGRA